MRGGVQILLVYEYLGGDSLPSKVMQFRCGAGLAGVAWQAVGRVAAYSLQMPTQDANDVAGEEVQ